jgi:hypothetical protein
MSRLADFIHHEHNTLRLHVELIRVTADAVGEVPLPILRDLTNTVLGFLVRELIPHAREEREILYKTVEQATQAPGSTATMNREHLEVSKMADQLGDLHALTVAEAVDHPDGWTHMANVVRVRNPSLGVALLQVVDRVIEDARVTLSGVEP